MHRSVSQFHFGARGRSRGLTFAPLTVHEFCMSESLDKTRSRVWKRSQDWAFLYCCVKKSDHSSWFSASCSSLLRDQLNWRSLGSFQLPLRLCRAPENSRDVPKMRGWVISKAWITREHGVDRKLCTGKTSCPLPIIYLRPYQGTGLWEVCSSSRMVNTGMPVAEAHLQGLLQRRSHSPSLPANVSLFLSPFFTLVMNTNS